MAREMLRYLDEESALYAAGACACGCGLYLATTGDETFLDAAAVARSA